MRLSSLVRFETARRIHPRWLVLPWSAFLSIHWIGAANGLDSDGLFGYAFLAALGVGLSPRIREDAERGFSRLCAVSLTDPRSMASARLASWVAWILLLGLWSLASTATVPGGLGMAGAKNALVFSLLGMILLPVAAAADRWGGLRLPLMSVYLTAVAAGLLASSLGGDPAWILKGLGIESVLASGGEFTPLVTRVPAALLLSWTVFLEAPQRGRWSSPWSGRLRLAIGRRTAMVDSDLHPKWHGPGTRLPSRLAHRRSGDPPGPQAHLSGVEPSASLQGDGPPPG
jgi:hypothetical protein